jgi:hypothetical protein
MCFVLRPTHQHGTHLAPFYITKLSWAAELSYLQEASSLFRTVQNDTTLMTMLNVVLPSLALESQVNGTPLSHCSLCLNPGGK